MEKYRLLRIALLENKILSPEELYPAPLAKKEQILLAHAETYYEQIETGSVPAFIMKRIGFPWSERVILRSRASVGGFMAACTTAIDEGFSANLSGGTHHAHHDRGEGFCVFNDFAIASLYLLSVQKVKKILIIDLDVHQGNGNSSILGNHKDVFVFSMHGKNNYPFEKIPSHLDVELPDNCEDEQYLSELEKHLSSLSNKPFDFIMYQAGVDPLKGDRFGKLSLSFEGLKSRDQMVFDFAKKLNIPMAMALGGGYAEPIENTIRAHLNTYRIAKLNFP